jgi:short-subunit dehydrogenase
MIRAGKGGNLVNVSSDAGLFGLPWHAAYSASKFGLRGVSEVLRYDLKRHGIAVTLACPGGVDTGLVNTLEIAGINGADPQLAKLKEGFRRHAKSPAQATRAILKGMKRGKYLVFTSFDIRFGYWWQRKFAPPFDWVMQKINDRFHTIMKASQVTDDAYESVR